MESVECDICGKEIKEKEKALGITNGTIEEYAEGFCHDDDPWVMVVHNECFWKKWNFTDSVRTPLNLVLAYLEDDEQRSYEEYYDVEDASMISAGKLKSHIYKEVRLVRDCMKGV